MNRTNLLALASASLVVGCHFGRNDGRLKTLDNIGLHAPVFDACQGNGAAHPKASLGSELHLKKALAAVPMAVQNGFFDDLGGRIRVSRTAECGNQHGRIDDTLGCWRRLADSNHSIEIIIQRTDPAKEQYALVRTFGFVYGDILLTRVVPKNISEPVKISGGAVGNLRDYKNHLSATFLGELAANTPKADLKELVGTLEQFGISSNVTLEKSPERLWQEFSRLPPATQDTFSSRVFAEAFHSQFCTAQSAARACKLFSATMESFEPYVQDLAKAGNQKFATCGGQTKASATHREWLSLHQADISKRHAAGKDTGRQSNSKIAQAVAKRTQSSKGGIKTSTMNLDGILDQLQGLLNGGLSNGGGGGDFSAILSQLLGGGGGGGSSLDSLLGNLGLGDLLGSDDGSSDDGGGFDDNSNGDNSDDGGGFDDNSNGGNSDDGSSFDDSSNTDNSDSNDNNGAIDNSAIDNSASNNSSTVTPTPTGSDLTTEEKAAIDATNNYRKSQGKSVLQVDPQMVADCRKQAQLQVQQGGLTHWLHPAGVARAENIAYGSKSGNYTVMDQWVKSPGHHANIMGNHKFIGVGNSANHWCQRFR